MRRVNLYAVKAAKFSTNRRIDEHFYNLADIFGRQIVFADLDEIFIIERAQSKLTNRRAVFRVNNFDELFILRNQFVIGKSHHAAEVKIIGRNAGKARDNRSDAAFSQFAIDFVSVVTD